MEVVFVWVFSTANTMVSGVAYSRLSSWRLMEKLCELMPTKQQAWCVSPTGFLGLWEFD